MNIRFSQHESHVLIAWDHINVFPTFNIYVEQFRIFKNMIKETLIYYKQDKTLNELVKEGAKCKLISYSTPKHKIEDGIASVEDTELLIFGEHNLQNLNARQIVGIPRK